MHLSELKLLTCRAGIQSILLVIAQVMAEKKYIMESVITIESGPYAG